jgi:putative DNA primase/helicase
MRRRLHVVPFTVTIPPERRNRSLARQLAAEGAGILSWMLEGCAEWQKHGLAAPERVHVAAEDYFSAEDLVGQWISERCKTGHDLQARSSDLFQSWRSWADSNGVAAGTSKLLGAALKARGFVAATVARSRGWRGLCLASPPVGNPE